MISSNSWIRSDFPSLRRNDDLPRLDARLRGRSVLAHAADRQSFRPGGKLLQELSVPLP